MILESIRVLLGAILLASLLAGNALGATYYFSITGNDAANGSLATPWKTLDRASGTGKTYAEGDILLFKKGDTWTADDGVGRLDITKANMIISAYGTGANPIWKGTNLLTGEWTDAGSSVWTVSITTQPKVVLFNGSIVGSRQTSAAACTANYKWYWAGNVLSVYATSTPASYYSKVEAAAKETAILSNGSVNGATIQNITIMGYNTSGISQTASTTWTVDGVTIKGIGIGTSTGKGVTGTGASWIVRNSNISYIEGFGISANNVTGWTIQGNEISYCWNLLAYGASGGGGGILVTAGSGHTVTRNYLHNNFSDIVSNGSAGNTFSYNLSVRPKINGLAQFGGNAASVQNWVNNTIIFSPDQTAGHGLSSQTTGTGFVAKNNLIYSDYTGASSVELVYIDASDLTSVDINNNLYFLAAGSTCNVGNLAGTNKATLANWIDALAGTAYTGKDTSSISADPLFVSATDFHLRPNSPAINAGTNVGLTSDFEGNAVPYSVAPDIGAYEYRPKAVHR